MTLRRVLCHRTGLSAFCERLGDHGGYDWAQMRRRIEAAALVATGLGAGYSPFIYGWVLGG